MCLLLIKKPDVLSSKKSNHLVLTCAFVKECPRILVQAIHIIMKVGSPCAGMKIKEGRKDNERRAQDNFNLIRFRYNILGLVFLQNKLN